MPFSRNSDFPCLPLRAFRLSCGRLMTLEGGGGSGSSSPDTRYKNLDQLYGVQTQASKFMLDQAMPNVATTLGNSATMVGEAMDGTLATRLREQAGNDSTATMGAALDANNRNMQRYGMGFSANRLLSENNRNAIMGAATKTGAMNKADQYAEEQKWNRNAGLFGQATGMNNGAMAGLSSAGAGLTAVNGAQQASASANAAGFGAAGSAFASALTKADGGFIEGEFARVPDEGFVDGKKPVRLASGGDAWAAYKAANPVVVGSGSSGKQRGGSPLVQMLGGAAPSLLGQGVKDLLKGGNSSLLKAVKGGYAGAQKAAESVQSASELSEAAEVARAAQALEEARVAADALTAASGAADLGSAASDAASGLSTLGDSVNTADAAFAAADTASAASAAADTTSGLASLGDSVNLVFANGGCVKQPSQKFALGGLSKAMSLDSMSVADDSAKSPSVAKMDSSESLSVAKMGTQPTSTGGKTETHAKPVDGFYGKTDGMGESSGGDPDGFGGEGADNRHMAGKATMSIVGNLLLPKFGGMIGSAAAEVLHPVGEAVSREVIMAGDKVGRALTGNSKVGGFVGAMHTDPIGTIFSGKYFAEGGDVEAAGEPAERADFVPGGGVDGPGTTTSDAIPAWLSDGEHVQNAVSTGIAGQATLDTINQAGRDVRYGKSTMSKAKEVIGQAMVKRGAALLKSGGYGVKPAVKLAGGGFLGGNLGIAMGAGVNEWHRQKEDTRRDQLAANQQQQMEWAKVDQAEKQRVRDEQATMRNAMKDIGGRQVAAAEEAKATAALEGKPNTFDSSAFDAERANAHTAAGQFDEAALLTQQKKQRLALEATTAAILNKAPTRQVLGEYSATGDMKTALPLLVKDENADQMAELRRQQSLMTADRYASEQALRASIEQAKLDWKSQNGKGGGSDGSGTGAGKAPRSDIYSHYLYKDPAEFTGDIRKRVAADGANAGMGGLDSQALATKAQQYTEGLMSGHLGEGRNVDQLFPVAYEMARREMGAKQLGPDGKEIKDESGAYKPYVTLGNDQQWYPRVRDGQGNEYTLSNRPVKDPGKFGVSSAQQAAAELKVPEIREAIAQLAKGVASGDKASLAQVAGSPRVQALLAAYQQPAAVAAPAKSKAPAVPARMPTPVAAPQQLVARGSERDERGRYDEFINPSTGQTSRDYSGYGLNADSVRRFTNGAGK